MTWKTAILKNEEEQTTARIGRYIEYLHNQFKQKGIKGLNKQEIHFIVHQSQGM